MARDRRCAHRTEHPVSTRLEAGTILVTLTFDRDAATAAGIHVSTGQQQQVESVNPSYHLVLNK